MIIGKGTFTVIIVEYRGMQTNAVRFESPDKGIEWRVWDGDGNFEGLGSTNSGLLKDPLFKKYEEQYQNEMEEL